MSRADSPLVRTVTIRVAGHSVRVRMWPIPSGIRWSYRRGPHETQSTAPTWLAAIEAARDAMQCEDEPRQDDTGADDESLTALLEASVALARGARGRGLKEVG